MEKKKKSLSLLHLFAEGAVNFTKLVIFKQASNLSFESFMQFLNAHSMIMMIMLSVSLNVLFIISPSICIYHSEEAFPKTREY